MPGRTLDRPPSDRYAGPTGGGEVPGRHTIPQTDESDPAATGASAEIKAAVAAVVGAALLLVLGGVLGLTTGPLFVAGLTGAAIGLLLAGSSRSRPWVRKVAVATAVAVVLVGAVGSWLIGLAEGGDLGVLDFLWATSGVLVPAELVVAAIAAAWGAGAGPITG